MFPTERSFYKDCSGLWGCGGVYKLSCVLLCAHVHPVPSFDTTASVWEKTSLQATVVSMVTGRVEVREEVERTGCSEAGREEVGNAYRRSPLPPLHTRKTASGVFCEPLCLLSLAI